MCVSHASSNRDSSCCLGQPPFQMFFSSLGGLCVVPEESYLDVFIVNIFIKI